MIEQAIREGRVDQDAIGDPPEPPDNPCQPLFRQNQDQFITSSKLHDRASNLATLKQAAVPVTGLGIRFKFEQ